MGGEFGGSGGGPTHPFVLLRQSAAKGGAGQFVTKPGDSLPCNTGVVKLLPVASVLIASPSGPVDANAIFDGVLIGRSYQSH